jgi:uncharacterized phage infection (PIP) family protein YhgE
MHHPMRVKIAARQRVRVAPMKRSLATVLLLAALAGACGESDEEKAQNDVCDARADIQKRVDDLSNLTLADATLDGIESDLSAIRDDLGTIADAQGELSDERRQQVQSANEEFTSQLQSIASDIGSSTSLSGAQDQLSSAFNQLADTYRQTFAKVDC